MYAVNIFIKETMILFTFLSQAVLLYRLISLWCRLIDLIAENKKKKYLLIKHINRRAFLETRFLEKRIHKISDRSKWNANALKILKQCTAVTHSMKHSFLSLLWVATLSYIATDASLHTFYQIWLLSTHSTRYVPERHTEV